MSAAARKMRTFRFDILEVPPMIEVVLGLADPRGTRRTVTAKGYTLQDAMDRYDDQAAAGAK